MRRAIVLFFAVALIIAAPHFIKRTMLFAPVRGISMTPVLKEGDLITYEEVLPSDVEVGDIIIYSVPPQTQVYYNCPSVVTHRVVEIKNLTTGIIYRTKGDNNPIQDLWSVRPCDLMGRVSQQIPYLGFLGLFLQSRSGLISIIITLFVSALCLYADELSLCLRKLKMRLLAGHW